MDARFCARCGAPLAEELPLTARSAMPAPAVTGFESTGLQATANKVRSLLIPILIGAVVILAIVLLALGPAHHSSQTAPDPVLNLSTDTAPLPDATISTDDASATTGSTDSVSTVSSMPVDVAAYLKFLQGVEERRLALERVMNEAPPAVPGAAAEGTTGSPGQISTTGTATVPDGSPVLNTQWQTLVQDFRATPIPDTCAALSAQYLALLYDGSEAKMRGITGGMLQVDVEKADTELGKVCGHYGAAKPFSIAFIDANASAPTATPTTTTTTPAPSPTTVTP